MFAKFAITSVILVGSSLTLIAARHMPSRADSKTDTLTISVRDFCDPATFNAIFGAGICVRDDNPAVNGSETVPGFFAELADEKSAGAWRFNPTRSNTREGVNITLVN